MAAHTSTKRGEIIREFGNELRNQKANLAKVITKEARKIVSEAEERSRSN